MSTGVLLHCWVRCLHRVPCRHLRVRASPGVRSVLGAVSRGALRGRIWRHKCGLCGLVSRGSLRWHSWYHKSHMHGQLHRGVLLH